MASNLAGLRYLVALCKDLNRRYDHYEAKLVRLERAAAAQATVAAAATAADDGLVYDGGYGGGQYGGDEGAYHAHDAYSGSPGGGTSHAGAVAGAGMRERPMGALDDGSGAAGSNGFGNAAERFAAPSIGFGSAAGSPGAAAARRADADEDQFADADLSDLLTE